MSCPTNLGCIPHCGTIPLPITIENDGEYFLRYSGSRVHRWVPFTGVAGQNMIVDLSDFPVNKDITFSIHDANKVRQTFINNGTSQSFFLIRLEPNLTIE